MFNVPVQMIAEQAALEFCDGPPDYVRYVEAEIADALSVAVDSIQVMPYCEWAQDQAAAAAEAMADAVAGR